MGILITNKNWSSILFYQRAALILGAANEMKDCDSNATSMGYSLPKSKSLERLKVVGKFYRPFERYSEGETVQCTRLVSIIHPRSNLFHQQIF